MIHDQWSWCILYIKLNLVRVYPESISYNLFIFNVSKLQSVSLTLFLSLMLSQSKLKFLFFPHFCFLSLWLFVSFVSWANEIKTDDKKKEYQYKCRSSMNIKWINIKTKEKKKINENNRFAHISRIKNTKEQLLFCFEKGIIWRHMLYFEILFTLLFVYKEVLLQPLRYLCVIFAVFKNPIDFQSWIIWRYKWFLYKNWKIDKDAIKHLLSLWFIDYLRLCINNLFKY